MIYGLLEKKGRNCSLIKATHSQSHNHSHRVNMMDLLEKKGCNCNLIKITHSYSYNHSHIHSCKAQSSKKLFG
ncbi:unnamed protein product [Lactuca virosa]|uniref:Uncharacterized protein n=1 Tax=Lactuca virosa TaxID=75947 RepID=A0AAU9PQ54_9ASTR|nr:unnamed protein product [Lactuca virosa]